MSESLKKSLNVALVGFPNSGKTTLYNWLTGSKFKTVNYPGSTVEYSTGKLINHYADQAAHEINYIDTPGIYSFDPQTADEEVTLKVIKNQSKLVQAVDMILLVVDGTQLSRQLILIKQLLEAKVPFKIVLTMSDLMKKNNRLIDIEKLKNELGVDIVLFEGLLGQGLEAVVKVTDVGSQSDFNFSSLDFPKWSLTQHEKNSEWSNLVLQNIGYSKNNTQILNATIKLDKILLHPVFGYVFFFAVMTLLFSSIYWSATPFMDAIESGFGAATEFVKENVPGLFGEFLSEGVIAAIGGVVIFVPQIFILFVLIYILESSGYLARVAALIDKPLSLVGLGGRSFVPMLSGFACAIPAIIATRNISSKKEKRLAQSLIPLLTCSARIPVYSLMISFLFIDKSPLFAGFVMAALYFASIVVAAIASGVLSRLIESEQKPKLMLDLPLYRRPKAKIVLLHGLSRAKSFLTKAGPIIFVLSIVIWLATNFPRQSDISPSENAQQSYASQIGQAIEPVFKPMGLDWKAGFGLISAFAAREVFVSSLALIYSAEGEDEAQQTSLLEKMHAAKFEDGTPVYTMGSSLGILAFFMIAMQCLATYAILRRETGGFKVATMQLFFSNLAAYVLAVAINQLFSAL